MKPIVFHGDTLAVIRDFPEPVKKRAGYQLWLVQNGCTPARWRPMPTIGKGVCEIKIKHGGEYRIIYIASIKDAVHVLGAFEKKSQKTPKKVIDLARKRLQEALNG